MAIRIPIITDLQDKGIRDAKAAFNNFKTSVANAEGGLGKFKAGSKSVMDSVSANAASFAIAGGIAFGKFAFDGVKAFQELALGAEKFATATGLAIEDASRYIEAAGDIGVPIDAVQTAIGKLNKTIGADPDKVRNLGIDLVYLKDGSLDVNATFLNTIDRLKKIKDPAEKAKVAAQLLGKGWQSMSTLIEMGADDLKASLDGVSKSKVITPEELKKAKELRDVMDDLKDKVEDLSLSIGQSLVPVLSDLGKVIDVGMSVRNVFKSIPGATWMADNLTPLALTKTALGGVKDAAGFVFDLFKDEKEVIPVFAEDMRNARDDAKMFAELIRDKTNPQLDQLAQKLVNAKTATDNAKAAWSNLIGQFERQVSFDKLDSDLDTLKEKAIAAFGGGKAEMDAFHEAQLIVAQDFEKMVEKFPPELSTKISIAIDSGDLAQLAWAAGTVKFLNNPIGSGGDDASIYRRVENQSIPARAMGGPVMGGQSYLVGERGPELFTPSSSGNITANGAMSGATVNVTVTSANPDDVVLAIQKWVRQNGSLPLAVTSGIRY